jgi:hypothetical protein
VTAQTTGRRFVAVIAVLPLILAGLVIAGTAQPAAAGELVKMRLHRAVKQLPVARETRVGYDRDKFQHWIDADGYCRDTRDEVLAVESMVKVRACDIQRGKWRSYYDGVVVRDSSGFDVDHMVALAEAWDSGARRWTAGTRKRFANDLGDRRTLVAVSASSNRSKSDRDPAEWLPTRGQCRYVREWTAVKIRWSLQVDRAEKRALVRRAGNCRNVMVRVREATVRTGGGGGGGTGDDGGAGGGGTDGGTDPRFEYCYQAKEAGYGPYYKGQDEEYYWYTDADNDGTVCE